MTTAKADTESLEAYVQADAAIRRGMFDDFVRRLRAMLQSPDPGVARLWACRAVSPDLDYTSLFKLRRFIAGPGAAGRREALRLAVLGGPTTTQLVQLLEVFLAAEGIDAEVYEGEYGLFRQEILNPDSGLARFKPQVVFLAVGPGDVAYKGPEEGGGASADAADAAELERWASLWDAAHSRWGCTVLQNLFPAEPWSALGHYAWKDRASREQFLLRLNLAIAEKSPAHVVVHPVPQLVAEAGTSAWFDPRFYFDAKMPCSAECLVLYAHSVMSLLRALRGRSKKALVLDLDNTLWGGVLGDVGPGGIVFGQGSGEGEAYLHFQEFALALRRRGVVLAACSKNDEAKALEAFERRSDMALKRSDFACFTANWNNKADNLRAIADALELGLGALVFVDDNPAERALVRRFLPEAAVPDMPEDPSEFIRALSRHRYFETVSLTAEDARRAAYYEANARRKRLAVANGDMESFLASLDMRAAVEPVGELNLQRVAQLVNKSNQFNLTTRRRTLGEIQELAGSPDWRTLTVSLADNLGDNGLISVIFLRKLDEVVDIDTWLMSCRVLQRGVEQFVLGEIVRCAKDWGCAAVRGAYIPTDRNGLVKDHYAALGFRPAGTEGPASVWELRVEKSWKPPRTHIRKAVSHERS